jgi:hypothetical protein
MISCPSEHFHAITEFFPSQVSVFSEIFQKIIELVDGTGADGVFLDRRVIDFIPYPTRSIARLHMMENMTVYGDIGTLLAETEAVPRLFDLAIGRRIVYERLEYFLGAVPAAMFVDADFDLVFSRFVHGD